MNYTEKPTAEQLEEGREILQQHIEEGIIKWDERDREYIGIAADGEPLSMGNNFDKLAWYLYDNPNSLDW